MAARKKEELRVGVDLTEVQEADDGDTTRYGGVFKLDGTEFAAIGNDRGDNHYEDLADKIRKRCAERWPRLKKFVKENEAFHTALHEAVTEGAPEGPCDLFDVVVSKTRTGLAVRTEEFSRDSKEKVLSKLPPKVRAARELGDLLGDMLANHVDEYEDELSMGLAESVAGCELEEAHLKPTDDVLNIALNEAMAYMREAMKPILRKALTDHAQTER